MRKLIFTCGLLIIAPILALAQAKRPMNYDDIMGLKTVAAAAISPDGKWVAYTVSYNEMKENERRTEIWMTSTTGGVGGPARRFSSGKNDTSPQWSPDGERLAFILSNVRDWGGGDYQDIQTGFDELVKRGISDPERMGQMGWSYGGYMTAWTLTQTNRFKAVMVGAGLTNMFSMYSTNDLQSVLEGYFGAEPWNDLDVYARASAMTHIKKARTPTLILHGQNDTRVPIGQAQELYMGLKKNGVPVQLVFFPREGHGLAEPRHQLDKMRREYAWFAKYVLGESAPEEKPAPVASGNRE